MDLRTFPTVTDTILSNQIQQLKVPPFLADKIALWFLLNVAVFSEFAIVVSNLLLSFLIGVGFWLANVKKYKSKHITLKYIQSKIVSTYQAH